MFEKNDLDEFTLRFVQKTSDYFSNTLELYFFYISKLKIYFSAISNNIILSRIKLEITDIYLISNSLISSIGKAGQLILGLTLLFFIFFIIVFLSKPSNKKSGISLVQSAEKNILAKKSLRKNNKGSRESLMKIELQLLELQDQFHRGVISHQSYVNESIKIGIKIK